MIERVLGQILFTSRWLLAPFYLVLAFCLFGLLVKMVLVFVEESHHLLHATETDTIVSVLTFIDLALTGSLLVMVMLSGYENFVSRLDHANHKDWPVWMGQVDFSGLKLKLMSSIVAISAIELLRAFMSVDETSNRDLAWYAGIHLTFVVSALILAFTDRLNGHHKTAEK
ncbi:UPF0114 protein [Gluconacetobacter liquefaciens]|uniref:UPF0114 protein C7453_1147 n=1 Tax=Gluconacetobacter liquefaciens TaxID=89584 RepID=A0A370FV11_GLULI|nr:TIGR00645 family protein [Gluconacetobacter liquefaciens]MBB2187371.1 TIGR00645 family protein [Gluconacetobacter liquefaciens]RDI35472.1 uncharacterized protein (TIGR00645 family) [Gluconacetobacter liquefaciens]GBR12580.1 hypothetical protein AA0522_2555 [Gluconacetobacter liquefaciens NRIC 0522]GEB39566.1 UPF0114 protein [Gluconacetobacter liquefaciens]